MANEELTVNEDRPRTKTITKKSDAELTKIYREYELDSLMQLQKYEKIGRMSIILPSQKFVKAVIPVLDANVLAAYIAGDAYGKMKLSQSGQKTTLNYKSVLNAADAYAKSYKKLLVSKGGSYTYGPNGKVFKPWLRDLATDQRKSIEQIIKDGIKEGKATGVKQALDGSYPPNSVAADLKKYFNGRKSHASTIARTEIGHIQNHASVSRYMKEGYTKVYVLDGLDFDEPCREANGSIWSLDYAMSHLLEHPNCTRAFVVDPTSRII